jgi:hypothetical protein
MLKDCPDALQIFRRVNGYAIMRGDDRPDALSVLKDTQLFQSLR